MKKLLLSLLVLLNLAVFAQLQSPGFVTASGSITTQNLNPLTGVPTAGSFIRLTLLNASTVSIMVSGTYTGALSIQHTIDGGTTWVTYTNANQLVLETSGAPSATIASASVGAWTTDVAGLTDVRISGLAAMTGTAVVTIKGVSGASQQVGINQSLPAGANALGSINQAGTWTVQPGNTPNTTPWLVTGKDAHSAASTTAPLRDAGRVVPNSLATIDLTLVPGDVADLPMTSSQQVIVKQFGDASLDYFFHNTSVVTNTALQVLAPASGVAGVRNYITGITYQTDALGVAGNIWVLDGQGAIGTSATIAVPGVFTSGLHDLKIGSAIVFTSLGTITGVVTNTIYYVVASNFTTTTFSLSLTQGGAAITTTGSTSTFTFYRLLFPLRLQTTAVAMQTVVFETPLKTIANSPVNLLIPASLTSGNIYLTINGFRGQ